jgi:hypothetical protein
MIREIMCCTCGDEREVDKQPAYGHVWLCHACGLVSVKVYPIGGGREWVVLTDEQVRFNRLVPTREEEEAEHKPECRCEVCRFWS